MTEEKAREEDLLVYYEVDGCLLEGEVDIILEAGDLYRLPLFHL